MERHEPQREERNKQSRRDEPDEDLLDHLGEPSAEPAQESNELCDVAIEGEDDCGDPDDTEPICGRARGKARIINGFISDEADSALIEKKVEDKRFFTGEADVDLAMIFEYEERDVDSIAGISDDITNEAVLEYNEEIDDNQKRKSIEDEVEPSPESQGGVVNEDDERFLIIYHENSSEDVEANFPPANDR